MAMARSVVASSVVGVGAAREDEARLAAFGPRRAMKARADDDARRRRARERDNAVRNTKYTRWTFVPYNLGEQFRRFMNRYFLLIATLQLWSAIAPVNPWSTWGPLIVIVAVSAARELNDDLKRGKADDEYNNTLVRVAAPGEASARDVPSRDVRPGDILLLRAGEECPCDAVVLASQLPGNAVLIETSALDGEADTKRRASPFPDAALPTKDGGVPATSGEVEMPAPDGDVRTFRAVMHVDADAAGSTPQSHALHEGHAILKGCTVVQCGPPGARGSLPCCAVIAVYTGQETKVAVASATAAAAPPKRAALDARVDAALASIFALQLLAVMYCGVVRGNFWREHVAPSHWYLAERHQPDVWYLPFLIPLRFELLCSVMIPISLKVTIDLCKSYYARLIEWDVKMADGPRGLPARANATEIAEDLGQISHLLCDKTGTLTENRLMLVSYGVLAPVSAAGGPYGRFVYPVPDAGANSSAAGGGTGEGSNGTASSDSSDTNAGMATPAAGASRPLRRRHYNAGPSPGDEELALLTGSGARTWGADDDDAINVEMETHASERRQLFAASLLCTTVTAMPTSHERAALDGASPDELAIAHGAARTRLARLHRRDDTTGPCTLDLGAGGGGERTFDVLDVLEFTSERRRMSVVVRGQLPGGNLGGARGRHAAQAGPSSELFLVCKGSVDVVFEPQRLAQDGAAADAAEQGRQASDFLALKGLRALGVAWRALSESEYATWYTAVKAARESLHDRDAQVAAAYDKLERGLNPLGVLGIEDELQAGVAETVARLKRAGVAVWMLTGDQRATAMHVAHRAGLAHQQPRGGVVEVVGGDAATAAECLREAVARVRDPLLAGVDHVALLHGDALEACLAPEEPDGASREALAANEALLLSVAAAVSGVVCYRCTPQQKARLCRFAQRVCAVSCPGGRVAAIGDGGNDVSMIRAAHVGIGVAGREGSAACLASDYAIERYRHLQRLLLVHGRYAHKRTALVTAYSIYKSMLLSLCQLLHNGFAGAWSGTSLFPASSLMLYNALYTNAAALFLVLDKDVDEDELLERPECYRAACHRQPVLLPNSSAVSPSLSSWGGGSASDTPPLLPAMGGTRGDVAGGGVGGGDGTAPSSGASSVSSPAVVVGRGASGGGGGGALALGVAHLATWLTKSAWDACLAYAVFASSLGAESSFADRLRGGGDTAVEANGVFSACLWAAAMAATLSASRLTLWQVAGTWVPVGMFYAAAYYISDVRNRGDDGGSALATFLHPAYALSLLLYVALVLLPYLLAPMFAVRRSWSTLVAAARRYSLSAPPLASS